MTRTKIKHMSALLAAATLTAVASAGVKPAEAAIVIDSITPATDYSSFVNGGGTAISDLGNRLIDFNGSPFSSGSLVSPNTVFAGRNQQATFSGAGRVVEGSLANQYAAPAADAEGDDTPNNDVDNTRYLTLGGNGEPGPVTLTFKYPIISKLGFLWGSIDTYNKVIFNTLAGGLFTFSGEDITTPNPANGNQGVDGTAFVNFLATENDFIKSVTFLSQEDDGTIRAAFELDDIRYTEVPTPALLPGLIGMGIAAMRKRKQVGEAQEA